MQFNIISILFTLITVLSTAAASPVPLSDEGVLFADITFPDDTTFITAGDNMTVAWDPKQLPDQPLPATSLLILGYLTDDGVFQEIVSLDTDFALTNGFADITFPPDLETRDTYFLGFSNEGVELVRYTSDSLTIHAKN